MCPDCGYTFYRNPRPTTSVVVRKDSEVLLAKRAVEPEKGQWDLLGGFLEYDEAPRDCALREVKEETGLDIKIEKFLGFYPDRYFDTTNQIERSVLTIGFLAEAKNKKEPTPQDDVEELEWFELDDLPSEFAFDNTKYFLEKVDEQACNG